MLADVSLSMALAINEKLLVMRLRGRLVVVRRHQPKVLGRK